MNSSLSRAVFLALLAAGGRVYATAQSHLNIIPVFTVADTTDFPGSSPISSLPNAAAIEASIDTAVAAVDTLIANPLTMRIVFLNDPETGLAESQATNTVNVPYSSVLSKLNANTDKSPDDTTALASLPKGPGTGINSNANSVGLMGPDLLALGFPNLGNQAITQNDGRAGYIGLNVSQMYTRSNPNPNLYDLVSSCEHEIDEILGAGGQGSQIGNDDAQVGMLDLFRYSAPGVHSFSTSPNVSSYFSINGGKTDLVHFNQLITGPGGGDAADWGDGVVPADGQGNTPSQVQDAFGNPGVNTNIGKNEAISLDVIGWNLTAKGLALAGESTSTTALAHVRATAIPEPSEWVSLAMGAIGLLAYRRRRR